MRLLAQQPQDAGRPILVHRRGKLVGVVRYACLLEAMATSREEANCHLMPLSGMPGTAQADRWMSQRRHDEDPPDLALIDLRYFNAYNRAHGYELGDQMLLSLVELIREELVHAQDGVPFCAHLGNDRFLVACRPGHQLRLRSIIDRFRERRGRYFSNVEIACNGFRAHPEDPQSPVHPLTSVRVIYFPNAVAHVETCRDVQRWAESVSAGEDESTILNEVLMIAAEATSPRKVSDPLAARHVA